MAKSQKTWRNIGEIDGARRGYVERKDNKLSHEFGQDTLRRAQIRSQMEDRRIEREALDNCRDPWDLIQD